MCSFLHKVMTWEHIKLCIIPIFSLFLSPIKVLGKVCSIEPFFEGPRTFVLKKLLRSILPLIYETRK